MYFKISSKASIADKIGFHVGITFSVMAHFATQSSILTADNTICAREAKVHWELGLKYPKIISSLSGARDKVRAFVTL